MQRIALGGLVHETHGFSPTPTVYEAFSISRGPEIPQRYTGHPSPMGGFLAELPEALPTLYATATPGGMVPAPDFQRLTEELVQNLVREKPEGIALALHGAMLAEGCADCEGSLLARLRGACPGALVAATLDLHANISAEMVEHADLLIGYDENPHLDQYARGQEAAQGLLRMLRTGKPCKAFRRVPLLLSPLTTWTRADPLAGALDLAHRLEQAPGVWSITVSGGFPYAEHGALGCSVLAYADTQQLADACAQQVAQELWSRRAAAAYTGFTPGEAVARAAFSPCKPVLLADTGDNIGGGSAGDSTFLLAEMLQAGVQGALVVLNDPEAVAYARTLGEGGAFSHLVGGKTDRLHGAPVPFSGQVVRFATGEYAIGANNHFAALSGAHVQMGPCALVRGQGVDLMLTSRRTPPGDLEMLYHLGLDPAAYRMIAVKSAVAFRGTYEAIAGEIIDVHTGGLCDCDCRALPYTNPPRLYPLTTEMEDQ